jgi:hypothetical protein
MKPSKYSALAAFFGLGKGASPRKPAPAPESKKDKLDRLSSETGVSVGSLVMFSRIAEQKGFTADDAYQDFGAVKPKELA